jgi:hypothetical protein
MDKKTKKFISDNCLVDIRQQAISFYEQLANTSGSAETMIANLQSSFEIDDCSMVYKILKLKSIIVDFSKLKKASENEVFEDREMTKLFDRGLKTVVKLEKLISGAYKEASKEMTANR